MSSAARRPRLTFSDRAYPPGAPAEPFDAEAWLRENHEELNNLSEEERHAGLISVDELRAAGALDVPPAWRKSLSAGVERKERNLFTGMPWDDEPDSAEQSSPPPEADAASDVDSPTR